MATAAAAVIAKAKREIQHAFFAADAVRLDRTIPFTPANGAERRQFDRLRAEGVIHEERPGRYWLDLPAYDAILQARHRRVQIVLLLLVAVLVGLLLFGVGLEGGRH